MERMIKMKIENEMDVHYTLQIVTAMNNLFALEENQEPCHIDVEEFGENETNLTDFFIGYLKAGVLMFNELTGKEESALEFTHILNQLCVQDMVKGTDLIKAERRI